MTSGGVGRIRALQQRISSGRYGVGSSRTCCVRFLVRVSDRFDDRAEVHLFAIGIISLELLAVALEIAVWVRCSCFRRGSSRACSDLGSASGVRNGVREGEVARNRPLARLRDVARRHYLQRSSPLDYIRLRRVGGIRIGSGPNSH